MLTVGALVAALVLGGGAFWLLKPESSDTAPTAVTPEGTTAADNESVGLSNSELADAYGDSVYQLEADGCGGVSTGTAWVLDDQHLVTNWHVVASDPTPEILSRDGQRIQGEVIGGGFDPDVAVVRADGKLSDPVGWSATGSLTEGQDVVALGYPAPAGDFTVTPGSVLSFQMDGGRREAIRMDGLIDKGNSGGPALTRDGEVAGVVTEAVVGGGGLQIVPIVYTAEALESAVSKMIADPQSVEADCTAGIEELPDDWEVGVPSESSAQNYGDDAALDALYDACESGDLAACDELFLVSPFGSDYETFALSCGDSRSDPAYGTCGLQEEFDDEVDAEAAEAQAQADAEAAEAQAQADAEAAESDAEVAGLVEGCDGGSMSDCDELGLIADFGTDAYDSFETCGGRYPDAYGDCVDREAEATSLEQLVEECQSGNMQACDDVSLEAPYDSEQYEIGESCGGFYENSFGCTEAEEESTELQGYYDDCADGDMAACDNAWIYAPSGSDIADFGESCGGRYEDTSGLCEFEYGN